MCDFWEPLNCYEMIGSKADSRFTTYLILHISQASWEVNRKDNENDIALWIAQGTKSVIFLLSSSIPDVEADGAEVGGE